MSRPGKRISTYEKLPQLPTEATEIEQNPHPSQKDTQWKHFQWKEFPCKGIACRTSDVDLLYVKQYLTEEEYNKVTKTIPLQPWEEFHEEQITCINDFITWFNGEYKEKKISYRMFEGKNIAEVLAFSKKEMIFRSIQTLYEQEQDIINKLKECLSKNNKKICLKTQKIKGKKEQQILRAEQYVEVLTLIKTAIDEGKLKGYVLLVGMLGTDDGIKEFIKLS